MSDENCFTILCGGCCVVFVGALQTWCNTNAFGADARCCQCGGPQGCCGSCCQDILDEDNFDEQLKRETERTKDTSQPVEIQPGPSGGMTTNVIEGTVSPAHNNHRENAQVR